MAKLFRREDPPKGGKGLKLWRMFTEAELPAPINKPKGEAPDRLYAVRPGSNQRSAGAAEYEIQWELHDFTIDEADETIRQGIRPEQHYRCRANEWFL